MRSRTAATSPTFESDLFRWTNYWKRQAVSDEVSMTCLIETHANNMFFPNIRELLTILAMLQMESTEAERSLHAWLTEAAERFETWGAHRT